MPTLRESGRVVATIESPSTAVPTKTWPGGLPVGVQVVGRRFDDALTLAMAALVEQSSGGFRPARLSPN